MSELTLDKEQQSQIKHLRKQVETEYKILKKVVAPELQIAHLERIIRIYNQIYRIKPPVLSDKLAFKMIKIQYKSLCVMKRIRPQPDCV